ncbi:hypothetical protein [Methylobacterium sp. E-046]|jgi:hypothetical protein|uniref:hypothetical protein n=1 Tax=Methylobacterium sp. E-046 TaxID=2836576 RepID=UPI001FB87C7C|nr:hypothetical protein [Methylobacterium sp. E-046]MCJ2103163.1 hypothetical protein [Methylobacterium sp. E-046]
MQTDIRSQVKAAILVTMAEAETAGLCPVTAARAAYPGTPGMVLGECLADLQASQEEAWWQRVERTIDVELIRNAVAIAQA